MANVPIPPGRIQDPFERRVPGMGLGRDPVRTPMQGARRRTPASRAASRGFRFHRITDW